MKITLQLLILAICAATLSSCCSVLPSCGGPTSATREVNTVGHPRAKTRVRRTIDSGTVTPKVLARVSAQASGEPHIGLIPTMKDLAPSD
jgi:hypothetical protein